jgi:flagellar motor switch protein FliG
MANKKKGDNLIGRQKAAILLLGLGEEIAPKVLETFTEFELQQISREISRLGNVPGDITEKIAREFVDAAGSKSMFYGGKDYLKNILQKTMGEEKTKNFLDKVSDSLQEKPFGSLAHVDPRVIASFIKAEHPQTVALILAHLESEKAAQILGLLPEGIQADVVLRIASLDRVPREMINEIENVLESELKTTGGIESQRLGGLDVVSELINNLDKNTEVSIMEVIEENDPDLAENIKKLMFTFDDLIQVDDRGIQSILKEINNEDLLLALKTATEEVKEKIFSNMSKRAASMVRDDLESLGPVRLSDVEKAQQVIVKVVRKLEEEGKIVIAGSGGGDIVV